MATMKIDQAGLPAGAAGFARTDGLDTGALVTLTSTGAGSTHTFRLLWIPPTDTTAIGSLAQTGPTVWTFSPDVGALAWGSYRIELIVDEGLPTESRQIRIFGVRTSSGLLIPAANEIADPNASLENVGATQIAASENNEPFGVFAGGSAWGWWKALEEVIQLAGSGAVANLQDAYDGGGAVVQTVAKGAIDLTSAENQTQLTVTNSNATAKPVAKFNGSNAARTAAILELTQEGAQIPVVQTRAGGVNLATLLTDGVRGLVDLVFRPDTHASAAGYSTEIRAGQGAAANDGGVMAVDGGQAGAGGVGGVLRLGFTYASAIFSGLGIGGSLWTHRGRVNVRASTDENALAVQDYNAEVAGTTRFIVRQSSTPSTVALVQKLPPVVGGAYALFDQLTAVTVATVCGANATPEGLIAARPGSVCYVESATASDCGLWFKFAGTGNTGWVRAASTAYVDQPASRTVGGAADTVVAGDVGNVVHVSTAGACETELGDLSASLTAGREMLLTWQMEDTATVLTIDPDGAGGVTIDGSTASFVATCAVDGSRVVLASSDGLAWFSGKVL